MTLTLTLPPETEAKLTEQARALGKAPEVLALEAIDERLSSEPASSEILPIGEWVEQFHAWVKSHHSRNPNLDDSRESLYPDRW
jgi:hypothetical protein